MPYDWSAEIKNAVPMRDCMEHYGIHVNQVGFCKCPFHSGGKERTGSFRIYHGNRGWYCYGCGEGGSVIDFVMKYFEVPFKDACKKLNEDFGLGFPIGEKLSEERQRELNRKAYNERRKREEYERERNRVVKAYNDALDRYTYFDKVIQENADSGEEMAFTDEYAIAVKSIETAKYMLDCAEADLAAFRSKNR